MSLIEAIVLGVVQGLTEFLPISSTAHLRIVPALAGWSDPGAAFTAVTQLGTMAAVLLYFRADLNRIARAWLHEAPARRAAPLSTDARLGWYLIVGTLPIVVIGFLLRHQIETGARDLYLIGVALVVLGLILGLADRRGRRMRAIDSLTWRDSVLIGCAQALALIPGVSRSGATISAGLLLDLDRGSAARYSFLLSVPAVVLSGLYELPKALSPEAGDPGVAGLAVATIFAFVVGYASIAFLLRWLSGHSVGIFVGYRVVAGAAVLALVSAGAIA